MGQTERKNNIVASAELVRRGATLLQEACPRCGGVQIRYQGKVYCLNEDDLDSVLNPKPQREQAFQQIPKKAEVRPAGTISQSSESLRKLLEEKLDNVSKQLESTTDVDEQARLLELISKYLETLEKLKHASS